jgi:hypothetical protein
MRPIIRFAYMIQVISRCSGIPAAPIDDDRPFYPLLCNLIAMQPVAIAIGLAIV